MARLMLYKKVHRQYLRQFRIGRKIKDKYDNRIDEVAGKPYIDYDWHSIWLGGWCLIPMTGRYSGILRNKKRITFLD